MSDPVPTVHMVDDDPSFLLAMSRLLRATGFVVKAFLSPSEFLDFATESSAGCAILDVRMPGMTGLDLQTALAEKHIRLPIVFLTGEGDIPTSVRAMRGGADDFLEKRAPREDLLAAVRRALKRDAHERARRGETRRRREKLDSLTDREREVLTHVIRGKLNKEIAADLGIHERTVKFHRASITGKLGLPSVAELTKFCLELGFPAAT